jgi:hypothetical protein
MLLRSKFTYANFHLDTSAWALHLYVKYTDFVTFFVNVFFLIPTDQSAQPIVVLDGSNDAI